MSGLTPISPVLLSCSCAARIFALVWAGTLVVSAPDDVLRNASSSLFWAGAAGSSAELTFRRARRSLEVD